MSLQRTEALGHWEGKRNFLKVSRHSWVRATGKPEPTGSWPLAGESPFLPASGQRLSDRARVALAEPTQAEPPALTRSKCQE